MGYRVAIVGATGNVGREMLVILDELKFPVDKLHALASRKSIGLDIEFGDHVVKCEDIEGFDFATVDLVLMSAGSEVSKAWSEKIGRAGAVVIDNSSAWRMHPDVPLIVPEVNPGAVDLVSASKNIIANPNCSTAQLVVALKPLHDAASDQTGGGGDLPVGVRRGLRRPPWTSFGQQTKGVFVLGPSEPKVFHQADRLQRHPVYRRVHATTATPTEECQDVGRDAQDDRSRRSSPHRHLRARAGDGRPLRGGQPGVPARPLDEDEARDILRESAGHHGHR